MRSLIVGIVDVFAEIPLSGIPLAVVEGAEGLSDDVLRNIARELNQSETTFLFKSHRADWKLRSFTANGSEVYGAGHNALGAWVWLGYEGKLGELKSASTFYQEIGDDILPVTLETINGQIHARMTQRPLQLGLPFTRLDLLAKSLGLYADDICAETTPRAADTGASHLMVRLHNREMIDRAAPIADELRKVLAIAGAEGCYIYSLASVPARNAYTRFFNPTVGLWEHAGTGTAAGPLCAFLCAEGLLREHELICEQGTQMGRRSILRVRLTPNAELSGSGIVVLRGRLHYDRQINVLERISDRRVPDVFPNSITTPRLVYY